MMQYRQSIPHQVGTRQIARLIAFFPGYFVFKNENVKVKVPVKYGFVLHTGFGGLSLLLKNHHLLLENEWNALYRYDKICIRFKFFKFNKFLYKKLNKYTLSLIGFARMDFS